MPFLKIFYGVFRHLFGPFNTDSKRSSMLKTWNFQKGMTRPLKYRYFADSYISIPCSVSGPLTPIYGDNAAPGPHCASENHAEPRIDMSLALHGPFQLPIPPRIELAPIENTVS